MCFRKASEYACLLAGGTGVCVAVLLAVRQSQIGKTRPVLFETEVRDGKMQGYTDNYVRVVSDYDPLAIDTLVAFNMQQINADFFMQGTFETLEISR